MCKCAFNKKSRFIYILSLKEKKNHCRFPQSGAGGTQDTTQGDQAFQDDGDDDLYS